MGSNKGLKILGKMMFENDDYKKNFRLPTGGRYYDQDVVSSTISLCLLGSKEAEAILMRGLANKSRFVAPGVCHGLGEFGRGIAIDVLGKALEDSDMRLRSRLLFALCSVGGKEALALAQKYFMDKDKNIAREAVYTLATIQHEKALPIFEKALEQDKMPYRGWQRKSPLGLIACEKAVPFLGKVLKKGDARYSRDAIAALGMICDRQSESLLEEVLSCGDMPNMLYAAGILAALGNNKVIPVLKNALHDKNRNFRVQAALTLGKLGGEQALKILENVMLREKEYEVKRAALKALGDIGGKKVLGVLKNILANDGGWQRETPLMLVAIGGVDAIPLLKKDRL